MISLNPDVQKKIKKNLQASWAEIERELMQQVKFLPKEGERNTEQQRLLDELRKVRDDIQTAFTNFIKVFQ